MPESRKSFMSTASELLHHHVWPEIEAMMMNDAFFRLVLRARQLTGRFNGPTAKLLQDGYLTQQMVTIRRLCDGRSDVFSLRRALEEAKREKPNSSEEIDRLLESLKACNHVRDQVNKHVAHTANPSRTPCPPQKIRSRDFGQKPEGICGMMTT
jgi:hypothetical protein